jgi:hypothetical protein
MMMGEDKRLIWWSSAAWVASKGSRSLKSRAMEEDRIDTVSGLICRRRIETGWRMDRVNICIPIGKPSLGVIGPARDHWLALPIDRFIPRLEEYSDRLSFRLSISSEIRNSHEFLYFCWKSMRKNSANVDSLNLFEAVYSPSEMPRGVSSLLWFNFLRASALL